MEPAATALALLESLLVGDGSDALPAERVREQVLDLARSPRGPIDRSAYHWSDLAPGIQVHLIHRDPVRGMQAVLIWGRPGARHHRHRHGGDENVLVLEGALGDERGVYGPGDICRSPAGSVHTEEVVGDADCICFVVSYGPIEPATD